MRDKLQENAARITSPLEENFCDVGIGVWVLNLNVILLFLAAPSAPRELELIAQNASVMFVSWVKPAVLNGYLHTILYRINYAPQNGNTSEDFSIQHSSSGSPQNFTLVGLSPYTVYSVGVYAGRRRNDGVERWSGPVSKTKRTWQLGERSQT